MNLHLMISFWSFCWYTLNVCYRMFVWKYCHGNQCWFGAWDSESWCVAWQRLDLIIPPAVLLINPTFWVSCRVISAIIELRGSAKAYKHKNNLDIIWTANIDCIEADEQEGLLLVVFWTHAVRWTQTVSQPHTHTMHVAHAAPGTAHTLDSVWWKKRGTCVCLWV